MWVLYTGEPSVLWHQRWITARVSTECDEYVIRTTDGDTYLEEYFGANADISAFRFSAVFAPSPASVPRDAVYQFRVAPTAVQRLSWDRVGAAIARDRRGELGVFNRPSAELPPEQPLDARRGERRRADGELVAGDYDWHRVLGGAGDLRSEPVVLTGAAKIRGDVALDRGADGAWFSAFRATRASGWHGPWPFRRARKEAPSRGDARVLPINLDGESDRGPARRRRPWREVAEMVVQGRFED